MLNNVLSFIEKPQKEKHIRYMGMKSMCLVHQDRLSQRFLTEWSSADPLRRRKQNLYCHFQRGALNTPNPWHLTR